MKIYEHTTKSNEKNYSLGFTLSEDQREAFQNIEKRITHLAKVSKPKVSFPQNSRTFTAMTFDSNHQNGFK